MAAPEELRFDLFGADDAEPEVEVEVEPPSSSAALSTAELTARLRAVQAGAGRASRPAASAEGGAAEESLRHLEVRERVEIRESLEIVVSTEGEDTGVGRLESDAVRAEDTLSIAAFYERVRRALRGAFPDEVWVTGEIRGLREARGHHYLELCDQGASGGQRGAAQTLEVVCWARDWPPVAAQLAAAGVDLEVGRVVRVRGKVSVWEGGSRLRFTLTALDVEALLGGIAAARRRLLQALDAEGLLGRNAALALSPVPLRVGVVTSPGSEAHRDFVGQLESSGFAFVIRVESSLVQGSEAPTQLAAALRRLEAFGPDLAVVIRGGGGRGDLAAFDSEEVARAIAKAPFPVWTGIGHTGDRSVADEVAHRSLITPTATGEAIVQRVAQYWSETERRRRQLASLADARLDASEHRLQTWRARLQAASHRQLDRRGAELAMALQRASRCVEAVVEREHAAARRRADGLARAAERAMSGFENGIERRRDLLAAFDPRRQLERGWSLTRTEAGVRVRSTAGLEPGISIVTTLADGEILSVVAKPRRGEDG